MDSLTRMIILLTDIKLLDDKEKERSKSVAAKLERAVEDLPMLEKRVIKMAYSLNNSSETYESLASEFNISVGEVWEAHHRGLRLLREAI